MPQTAVGLGTSATQLDTDVFVPFANFLIEQARYATALAKPDHPWDFKAEGVGTFARSEDGTGKWFPVAYELGDDEQALAEYCAVMPTHRDKIRLCFMFQSFRLGSVLRTVFDDLLRDTALRGALFAGKGDVWTLVHKRLAWYINTDGCVLTSDASRGHAGCVEDLVGEARQFLRTADSFDVPPQCKLRELQARISTQVVYTTRGCPVVGSHKAYGHVGVALVRIQSGTGARPLRQRCSRQVDHVCCWRSRLRRCRPAESDERGGECPPEAVSGC